MTIVVDTSLEPWQDVFMMHEHKFKPFREITDGTQECITCGWRTAKPTKMVRVHVFSGADSKVCAEGDALATLADMTGFPVNELHIKARGYVAHWSFRDAGSDVGRIAQIE